MFLNCKITCSDLTETFNFSFLAHIKYNMSGFKCVVPVVCVCARRAPLKDLPFISSLHNFNKCFPNFDLINLFRKNFHFPLLFYFNLRFNFFSIVLTTQQTNLPSIILYTFYIMMRKQKQKIIHLKTKKKEILLFLRWQINNVNLKPNGLRKKFIKRKIIINQKKYLWCLYNNQ